MTQKTLTCIVCPRGCLLTVALTEKGEVAAVGGNLCPRGKTYAEAECTHPVRTVTTTVRTEDGAVVACKTAGPVPKEKVFEVMRAINKTTAPSRIRVGDVLIQNVADTDVDVVATAEKE